MKDSQIVERSGREIAYTDIGDEAWPCVLFFHGAPMSRLCLAHLEQSFLERRLRVVSPDRPGYGKSSPQPGRSLLGWPADVAAVADALGIERFVVAGHSAGGPYALATAAVLPHRVTGAVALAGVTDMGWPRALDDYFEMEKDLMQLADEESAIAWCIQHFREDASGFFEADFEMPAPDAALLADEKVGPSLTEAMEEAFRQGIAGFAQDAYVYGRQWEFDPASIAVPVQVVHGDADSLQPMSHSRHTAELIPGSELVVLPGHGHLTALSELPGIASAMTLSLS